MANERNHDVEVVLLCRIGTFRPEWMNVCGNRKSVVGWNLCFFRVHHLKVIPCTLVFFLFFIIFNCDGLTPYITRIRGLLTNIQTNNRQKQSHHFLTDQIRHFELHLIQLLLAWGAITPPQPLAFQFQQGPAQIGSVPRRTIYINEYVCVWVWVNIPYWSFKREWMNIIFSILKNAIFSILKWASTSSSFPSFSSFLSSFSSSL